MAFKGAIRKHNKANCPVFATSCALNGRLQTFICKEVLDILSLVSSAALPRGRAGAVNRNWLLQHRWPSRATPAAPMCTLCPLFQPNTPTASSCCQSTARIASELQSY